MNRDTITGIVGAVILVTAMIGVFQYERSISAATGNSAGALTLANVTGSSLTGSLAAGATFDDVVNVTHGNLTLVTFTLQYDGGAGLSLNVESPTGNSSSGDGNGATVSFVVGSAESSAGTPWTLGTGDYKVSVANTDAPQPTDPVPVVGGGAATAFEVVVTYQAWSPSTA